MSIGKTILERAVETALPYGVIHRGGSGFGASLRRWLRQELRGHTENVLSTGSLKRRGLFDPATVHRLIQFDRMGKWVEADSAMASGHLIV